MKPKGKKGGVNDASSDCGRMKYSGVDMAFIHVRGKRMLAMSEVSRKLYPQWPRTTLFGRLKQMDIRKHVCTPREMKKVHSLDGIKKQGINCRLISLEDLDAFSSVYRANTSMNTANKANIDRNKKGNNLMVVGSFTPQKSLRKPLLNKQNQKDKKVARVITNLSKSGKVRSSYKRHVASRAINKATSKQQHVGPSSRSHGLDKQKNALTQTKGINRKRKLYNTTIKAGGGRLGNKTGPKKRRIKRETMSPASDCISTDSGVSSLPVESPVRQTKKKKASPNVAKNKLKRNINNVKGQIGVKSKTGRKKYNKNIKKIDSDNKMVHGKKITKEFVMDLKQMNDKDLIHSFSKSPFSTNNNTPANEETPYLIKLMPVKPVWKVNQNFRFISNFLLPPSLIVQDGDLQPACSMVCKPGLRPPNNHPIWKWKIGEPVVGNKTEISYRVKKIKCLDSVVKKKQ